MLAGLGGIRNGRLEIVEGERELRLRADRGAASRPDRGSRSARLPLGAARQHRARRGLRRGSLDGRRPRRPGRIACRNLAPLDRAAAPIPAACSARCSARQPGPARTPARARAGNISAHYDLGNWLFESFLDERLQYSAAVFADPEATLERAQLAKLERICDRARPRPRRSPARDRHRLGRPRVHAAADPRLPGDDDDDLARAARLRGRADPRAQASPTGSRSCSTDYRDLAGSYDKLVSIEMIEAVGWQYFGEFFAKCAALTRPGGAMFLQAIVIGDEAYEAEKASRSFANKHIFPGGCLPSLRLITGSAPRTGSRSSAATTSPTTTPARCRSGAIASTTPGRRCDRTATTSGSSRLWNFYLAFSEGGFRERRIRDLQIVLAKPGRRPRTRPMAIAYTRAGSGEPLILLHGLGGSRRIWGPVIDRLAAERDVIAVDLPGFGESPELPADVTPTPANLGAAGRRAVRRARDRTPAPRRATRSAAGSRSSWPRPASPPRSARSPPPASGAGRSGRGRFDARALGAPAASADALLLALARACVAASCGHRRPARSGSAARTRRRWCATGSTPPATTRPTTRCARTIFEHPERVDGADDDRLGHRGPARRAAEARADAARRPLRRARRASATRRPGTTRS